MAQEGEAGPGAGIEVKVWDVGVRVFHWALTLLLVLQVVTGKLGGRWMPWHVAAGYGVLVLVVFRILWGFGGGTHARFSSFLKGPVPAYRFARRLFSREAVPQLGHNPLGGWMVVAMIAAFAFQAVTGLFANDGVETEGPFATRVGLDVSDYLSRLHRIDVYVLMVLAGLHIAAVLYHWLFKKEDLIGSMVDGRKRVPAALLEDRRAARRETPQRRIESREPSLPFIASVWRALGFLAVAALLVFAFIRGPF
jgi:cytochrome b